MIYQFNRGLRIKGLDAQAVGEDLERIRRERGGQLRPVDVLVEAAADGSPLHPAFTWGDSEAANQWRLQEAQKLIRHVIVVTPDIEAEQKAFHHVVIKRPDAEEPESYYQSAAVLASSPDEYAAAVKQVLQALGGAERSLNQLKSLAPKNRAMNIHRAGSHVVEAHRLVSVSSP